MISPPCLGLGWRTRHWFKSQDSLRENLSLPRLMLCFSPLAPYQACFGRIGGLEMGSREHWKGPSCGMEEFLEEPMNDLEERSEWRVTVTAQGSPCMGVVTGVSWQGTAQRREPQAGRAEPHKYQWRASSETQSAEGVCQVSWSSCPAKSSEGTHHYWHQWWVKPGQKSVPQN